jgi:adenylate cyclase class IV
VNKSRIIKYSTYYRKRNVHILLEYLKGKGHFGRLGLDWNIILKMTYRNILFPCKLDSTGFGRV